MAIGADFRERANIARIGIAFVLLFAVYQISEGLQTIIAPASPAGPALMVLTLLLAWPLGRWLGWRGYDAYGLDLQSRSFAILGAGMLIAAVAFLTSRSLGTAMGIYSATSAVAASSGVIAFALVSTFIPSVAEDILTRGFLLRTLPVKLTAVSYVVLSALLYTANHVWRFDWGISEQVRLFCLGLAYGAAAWRWRNLWAAVALHWGWNLSNVLVEQLMPADNLSIDAARYLSAAVNLAMLGIVVLLPRPSELRETSARLG
uniref:CPBP family intramembrane glutamic endopeptidase n=1 Tax=Altererythrobacter segetis TaxID=1104773 RepID=UPI0014077BA7|nr:type II CAAX endopeptidase family protein [Altererythrobacter segetis]